MPSILYVECSVVTLNVVILSVVASLLSLVDNIMEAIYGGRGCKLDHFAAQEKIFIVMKQPISLIL